ncbi:S8 family peptidase [Faecalimonas sp.]
MNGQKLENVLNLALDATEEERAKSLELDVGYNPIERIWDLIVKYSGNLDKAREIGAEVVELQNEFAIITIEESKIERLALFPEIEYIEKPKRLFFQVVNGRRASCITSVQNARPFLFGKGILVAVIDSGISYANEDFRNEDGSTRIRLLWDQSISGNPPSHYSIGTEYTSKQINEALQQKNRSEQLQIVPSIDTSGHGTAVAGIAAGNGKQKGVAIESDLIIVKLASPRKDGFPRTTELMQALDYVVRKAKEFEMPVAINMSFGNTYGAHDGTSLLERFIDNISNYWKSVICVGSGNEGASAGHTSGKVEEGKDTIVQLAIQENEQTVNLQLWKSYSDVMDISIISPSGIKVGPIQEILGSQRFRIGETELLIYYGEPSPYSTNQEIYIDFLPKNKYIMSGIWKIVMTPKKIVTGIFEMWLPSESVLNKGTAFLYPIERNTITIPSTASQVISVGAYDALTFTYADFSGRGGEKIPDVVAPGVDILAPTRDGTYEEVSGTSFATPFVTGGAALLMEWGITKGNDLYLYGEKVKAYLQRGARPLPAFKEYPNIQVGYGALCVRDSFPV